MGVLKTHAVTELFGVMRRYLRKALALIFCMFAPSTALAEGGLRPVTALQETYARAANVSGFLLVGLRRGDSAGPLDLSKLEIEVPNDVHQKLCLQMTTRDATYSGQQAFDATDAPAGPEPLNLKSKFATTLATYGAIDLSARVELRLDCASGDSSVMVPVSFLGAGGRNSIYVYLNTQTSAARVALLSANDSPLVLGQCTEIVEGARTAYDRICRFVLDDDVWTKVAKLKISLIGLTGGVDDEVYPVALGPAR